MPFTRLCGLCSIEYGFIGKIETIDDDAESLRKLFPEKLKKLASVLNSKKNVSRKNSDNLSQNYFSHLPKDLILKLYEAYKSDFLIGGYPYPTDYIAYAKS